MLIDEIGLLIICGACTVIGFAVGWMGGAAEGRGKKRDQDAPKAVR